MGGGTTVAPSPYVHLFQFDPVTWEEVSRLLVGCRPATSPLNPCPAWLIKAANRVMVDWVMNIINSSLSKGPSFLKETFIQPIINNSHLIVNILFMGKVIKQVAAKWLQTHLEE